MAPQAAPLALSANGDPARFAAFGLTVLTDDGFVGHGPLAGVLAGMDWAATRGATVLLTVPGDTPFIPRDLAAALAPPPGCAASGSRVHHLVALWPVAAREALRGYLGTQGGSRGVQDFAATIGMRPVVFPAVAVDPLYNANTPDDVAAARAMATRTGPEDKP